MEQKDWKKCDICDGEYTESKHNFEECYSLDIDWDLEQMKPTIKYIDLCCGIGGFRVGISKANTPYNFKCVYSADIKPDAIKTYNKNFNENMVYTDVMKVSNLPDFDLLCAGFPCQPFSSAGNKKGLNDDRGGLIFKILDICAKYKPNMFILENVPNLITLKKGTIIKKIVDMFVQIGYNVSFKKLNSKKFGVPQNRERVYIIGCLSNMINMDNIITSPMTNLSNVIDATDTKTNIPHTFSEKIMNLHRISSVYGHKLQDKRGGKNNIHSWTIGTNGRLSDDEKKVIEKIMLERRKKHWAVKKKMIWMDGIPLTLDDIKTFHNPPNLLEMLSRLCELKYLRLERCKDLIEGKRIYRTTGEKGYNICKGKLSFPISNILNPTGISPTLTATDSIKLAVITNGCLRRLNTEELKLICGFPKSFIVPPGVNKYDLFGNMVTPPVITKLIELLY
jgi:DNA (cytosine-5)-methyltransferase 1